MLEFKSLSGIPAYGLSVVLAAKLAECFERKLWSWLFMLSGVVVPILAHWIYGEIF